MLIKHSKLLLKNVRLKKNIFNHAFMNCIQVMNIFLSSEQFKLEVPAKCRACVWEFCSQHRSSCYYRQRPSNYTEWVRSHSHRTHLWTPKKLSGVLRCVLKVEQLLTWHSVKMQHSWQEMLKKQNLGVIPQPNDHDEHAHKWHRLDRQGLSLVKKMPQKINIYLIFIKWKAT